MNSDEKKNIDEPKFDEQYINVDPLRTTYHQSIVDHPAHIDALKIGKMALLVIDVQYLDAAEGYGVFKNAESSGVPIEAQEYYFRTLKEIVLPNIQLLQKTFRNFGLEVIHTRIQSMTMDGRDRSAGHKRLGLHAPPGSKEAQILDEVAPVGDEMVISKTASGVFPSTNLHYILTNLDIEALIITGVYTNECVSSTVREACDLGFSVTLVEDGCTTVTADLQNYSLAVLRDRYARVRSTLEVVDEIEYYMMIQKQKELERLNQNQN